MIVNSAEFVISNSRADKCPDNVRREYAFIGRSNVGKSSLINMLTGRNGLAMTSATPGKTMLINHFLVNKDWHIVDLPGYGYAKRSKTDQEKLRQLIRHYVLDRHQLTTLFVLIDSRLPPQTIDLDFIRFLGENGVPFSIIFTKADKSTRTVLARNIAVFLDKLREEWEELPPHFVTSSSDKRGRDEGADYIESLNNADLG